MSPDAQVFRKPSWHPDEPMRTLIELRQYANLGHSQANLWRYPPGAQGAASARRFRRKSSWSSTACSLCSLAIRRSGSNFLPAVAVRLAAWRKWLAANSSMILTVLLVFYGVVLILEGVNGLRA